MIEILDQYQDQAARTASDKTDLMTIALGLAGEAGEFADLIKKWHAQGHELDTLNLADELGDILWYLANGARLLDISLSTIATVNIAKLIKRYPEGFSADRSINRG